MAPLTTLTVALLHLFAMVLSSLALTGTPKSFLTFARSNWYLITVDIICFCFIFICCASIVTNMQNSENNRHHTARISTLTAEVAQLKAQIPFLASAFSRLEDGASDLQAEIEHLKCQPTWLKIELRHLRAQMIEYQNSVDQQDDTIWKLAQNLQNLVETLNEHNAARDHKIISIAKQLTEKVQPQLKRLARLARSQARLASLYRNGLLSEEQMADIMDS